MAQKTSPPSPSAGSDVGADYALIALGAGAALAALIYLILL